MPAKKSNPSKRSMPKKKARSQSNAAERISREGRTKGRPDLPQSERQIDQSRFPSETALTGEDRPANRSGGKVRGVRGRPAAGARTSDPDAPAPGGRAGGATAGRAATRRR